MFKDYDKYLSTSLKVYLFVLIFIFILKLTGLDYFGIEITNPVINAIEVFAIKYKLIDIYYLFTLYFYSYMITSTICEDNSKLMKLYILVMMPLIFMVKYIDGVINNNLIMALLDISFLYLLPILYNFLYKKVSYKKLSISFIKMIIINTLFQSISVALRVNSFNSLNFGFVINLILDLDYILLFIIYHKLHFLKGGIKCYLTEVGLSLPKKKNLKLLPKKLLENWHKFKKLDKVTKLTYIIYFIFSLIWNLLNILLILLVAKLNDTFIECIFILTSFWLSKKAFGKAFHLSSMLHCFIVSNITYYVLNRVTTPLGISIVIPILLGVGLSYVTSKLVKKTYKPLYRGMPEDLFEEIILKVVDKDSLKYKICYDFYIKKKSVISLAMKYNYTEAGIRKIKDRVNEKIKGLN